MSIPSSDLSWFLPRDYYQQIGIDNPTKKRFPLRLDVSSDRQTDGRTTASFSCLKNSLKIKVERGDSYRSHIFFLISHLQIICMVKILICISSASWKVQLHVETFLICTQSANYLHIFWIFSVACSPAYYLHDICMLSACYMQLIANATYCQILFHWGFFMIPSQFRNVIKNYTYFKWQQTIRT